MRSEFTTKKKKHIYLRIGAFFLLSMFINSVYAQLGISTSYNTQQLVQNKLVGTGVAVSNVSYSGGQYSIGYFFNGNTTNLGINSGVLLCSGDVNLAIGPNSSGSSGASTSSGSDPQLAALVPGYTVNDAAVLEFDFIPSSDTIKFQWVFGSDEYPEFVNSNFNDVFGFFVTGPNPNGPNYVNQNIALIPGTTLPVTIDNVNIGSYPQYYVNNVGGMTIEYDGFTTVLTAWLVVIPCQQYHIKIAVGDAGDSAYDSAVFLEENSFSSYAIEVNKTFTVSTNQIAYEGCNEAILYFIIPDKATVPIYIPIDSIYGSAINGIDYNHIADSVLIPAGLDFGKLYITPIYDAVSETPEEVKLIVRTSPCTIDTITIPIGDYSPLQANACSDTVVCQDTASLWAIPSGGLPPYYYSWSPSGLVSNPNSQNPTTAPGVTTNFVLEVSDTTGCPNSKDSVLVTVSPNPTVSFDVTPYSGCDPLTVVFTDMSMPISIDTWYWDFGDGNTSTDANPIYTYTTPGQYDITHQVVTDDGCFSSLSIVNLITVYDSPQIDFSTTPSPAVVTIVNPTFIFTDHTSNASSWEWSFGDGGTDNNSSTTHEYTKEGEYIVTLIVTTDDGCSDTLTKTVRVIVDEIDIPNVFTPNGDNTNDFFYIKNIDRIESSTLTVYNRWGKKVYTKENYQNDWDGQDLPDGTYFYVLKYKTYFRSGEESGTITIIR